MQLSRSNSTGAPMSPTGRDSAESMLASMNRFVSAVNSMDETILVPNRLKDMSAGIHRVPDASGMAKSLPGDDSDASSTDSSTPISEDDNIDLYSFYAMLNAVKMELERGGKPHGFEEDVNQVYKHGPGVKSKVKLNEAVTDDRSIAIARRFRSHISGLNKCLVQMTETAEYLSTKYQEEVGNI